MPPGMQIPIITMKANVVPIYLSFPARMQAMRTMTIQARVTGYLVDQSARAEPRWQGSAALSDRREGLPGRNRPGAVRRSKCQSAVGAGQQ